MVVSSVDSARDAETSGRVTPKARLSMLNQFTTSLQLGDSRLPARFWAKVRLGSVPSYRPDLGSCWEWTASGNQAGYGRLNVRSSDGSKRHVLAHRLAYEALIGSIPTGLESDHLCRNHACVNPGHLELVTSRENTLRGTNPCALNAAKTHCKWGHPFDEGNTYKRRQGWRECRTCWQLREHGRVRDRTISRLP